MVFAPPNAVEASSGDAEMSLISPEVGTSPRLPYKVACYMGLLPRALLLIPALSWRNLFFTDHTAVFTDVCEVVGIYTIGVDVL